MRIAVERDRCVAAGQCVLVAPDVFDQNEDDGLVILLDAEPVGQDEAVHKAAQLCPAQAIRVLDEESH